MIPRLAATLLVALALPVSLPAAARASAPAAVALVADSARATAPPADSTLAPHAAASTPARVPFESVALERTAPRRPHLGAYLAMAVGAGLAGASFTLQDRANRTYADYLQASDPGDIRRLYDRTTLYDRFSSGSLIGGEALIAAGLWMRFLQPARSDHLTLLASPGRCALALRF